MRTSALVALAVSAVLLSSCGGADRPAGLPGSSSGSLSADRSRAAAPVPSPDPVALADGLNRAVATVHDLQAGPDAVREAAELQQLTIRTLVRGSAGLRRAVVSRLSPEAAREARAQLTAARLLTVLTEPRRRFPPWRILQPPPPEVLLGYYRDAERRTGVPWTYLAAINLVETRMGRIRGPSSAGARGPMQFMPATWARYGAGGNINDPHDAIVAAARLLRDHGAPRHMAAALWHYNPSDKYVGAVTAYARTMQRTPAAYRGYWNWQVFCQLRRGAFVLPVGYPKVRPIALPGG